MSAPARRRPKPPDAEIFARACLCLQRIAQLFEHEFSFARGMAAISMSGTPSPEQSAQLMALAQRLGVAP
jgi:hypothetical protein